LSGGAAGCCGDVARRSTPRRWTKNVLDETAAQAPRYGDCIEAGVWEDVGHGAAAGATGADAGGRRRLPGAMRDTRGPQALSVGRVTRAGDTRVPPRPARVIHTVRAARVQVMRCREAQRGRHSGFLQLVELARQRGPPRRRGAAVVQPFRISEGSPDVLDDRRRQPFVPGGLVDVLRVVADVLVVEQALDTIYRLNTAYRLSSFFEYGSRWPCGGRGVLFLGWV